MTHLKVDKLSVIKSGKKLLDNVSFEIASGDILAVIGANGAGKSTLIRTLSGEEKIGTGTVSFNGRPWPNPSLHERAKMMGVLPQKSYLNFPFTVAELIALGRTPHSYFGAGTHGLLRDLKGTGTAHPSTLTKKRKFDTDEQITNHIIEITGMEPLRDRKYTVLSGGEKQRAQLARVLAQIWPEPVSAKQGGTRLLILDEPCAELDIAYRQSLVNIIKNLAQHGVLVVWIEHDLNLVPLFSTKLLALHGGRVVDFGDPNKCLNETLVKQVYGAYVKFIRDESTGKRAMML